MEVNVKVSKMKSTDRIVSFKLKLTVSLLLITSAGLLSIALETNETSTNSTLPQANAIQSNNASLTTELPSIRIQKSMTNLETNASSTSAISQETTTITYPINQETISNNSKVEKEKICSPACTSVEFSTILQRLLYDDGLLKRFKDFQEIGRDASSEIAGLNIRPKCVRELVRLIRNMASNELELKSVLEFVTDTSSRFRNSKENQTKQGGAYRLQRILSIDPIATSSTMDPPQATLDLSRFRGLQLEAANVDRSCSADGLEEGTKASISSQSATPTIHVEDSIQQDHSEKSRVLPKLVANVDHWINTLERFTFTREWGSLLKIFKGAESILDMFVANKETRKELIKSTNIVKNISTSNANSTMKSNETSTEKLLINDTDFVDKLRQNLPNQVLVMTTSLNNLFPWHVWPWNNIDLYSTIDTFLNHGIFAFSRTTVGPNRRIDFLHDMLQTLFKSLKFDTFPKKCTDWSKTICDKVAFHERLVLAPLGEEITQNDTKEERQNKATELAKVERNQLIQELTCIMFSSLSMQHFGGKDLELVLDEVKGIDGIKMDTASESISNTKLAWDKQVIKAIKLYTLSREALTDEQWFALYNLIQELWSQQKISDRIIMVGRVIQLLTNCHMPKEMLESALWKDIYKYKNVLNQLIDIVVEELNRSSETGQLTVQQISLGSNHLDEILRKFIKLLPNLIEALTQTVADQLPDLVNRFFTEKATFFKAPCKGSSFSDIFPSLNKYRNEVVEIEALICKQFKIKPNITMMQINHFTNDFLAMAFNFTTFGSTLTFPRFISDSLDSISQQSGGKLGDQMFDEQLASPTMDTSNTTSILDEMASNPRLAQVVAILQSSALDPPEVHAELPELDWVEAGTSIALLYESIQKLISYEGIFVVFPELDSFQDELGARITSSQQKMKKFSKRDPIRLVAYSLDTVMPVALRTFKPMETFHSECLSSFKDIFSEDIEGKGTRQWQCVVSSMNFASWAMNNFMKTFNSMFRNILTHMSLEVAANLGRRENLTIGTHENGNSTCIFFDGSVSMMLDNLPQFIDLALETVLMASTNSDQQLTLYDIMCSTNYMLDPFNESSMELKARMKDKMCHLFHKKSIANCAQVLRVEEWKSTMRELNSTWFETNAISINPSFRDVTINVHEFLELFGRFKPNTMSDSLIAKVLNVNSFWANLLNRTVNIIDKYQEKRFEYALQTLTPIIFDNLPTSVENSAANIKEVRETLITTILGARAILNYLDKQSTINDTSFMQSSNSSKANPNQFETQIQSLFNWADQYSMITVEVLLKTMANNITKLETIFDIESELHFNKTAMQTNKTTRLNMSQVWIKFCNSTVDKYLDLDMFNRQFEQINNQSTRDLSRLQVNQLYSQMNDGKEVICKFEWTSFYNQLAADSNDLLAEYPERQLTRIALTKWGQVLDVMLIESKHIKQLPKFFYMDYWQVFRDKLPQITPVKDQPSNVVWIWKGFERIVNAMDRGTNQTSNSLQRILDQLNCGLDAVKGGLSWENIANIYSDKPDILAAHSTINNGFSLASIGVNTFLAQQKFQKFLDEFVKPRVGLVAFCEKRDRLQLESIFSIPNGQDFVDSLESFQELICDTNFETLAQNINPISVCYQISGQLGNQQQTGSKTQTSAHPLADIMDRFFKLASLAIMDAKLVVASDAKPPILDRNKWSTFWSWWSDKAEPQPRSSVALTVVRAFQTLDSINSNHVVWKALFRSVHEISEVVAYLLRAVEKRHQEADQMIGSGPRLSLVKEAATQLDEAIRSNNVNDKVSQQQLASTLSNIMFPEVNSFISFRTFKQLRYIKTVADYFTLQPEAQELVCRKYRSGSSKQEQEQQQVVVNSRIDLIGYKLNTNDKLYSLMCHYHSSQWITALNIVVSAKTQSLPKKINYLTKYLSIFTRSYKEDVATDNNLESFIHGQQLENIENVANTTVSYLLATSQSLKSLSFSKISNISWHSLPNLLDSIDRHLCASRYEPGSFYIPKYEPKKPELEMILCKLPQWNITQIYNYLSEKFDLQNMISLLTTTTTTTTTTGVNATTFQQNNTLTMATTLSNSTVIPQLISQPVRTCVTPFKFASRWLKVAQDLVDEIMSKGSREKMRKCLKSSRKGQTLQTQSLRYIRLINSLLSSLDDLSATNSWFVVKRTWNSLSYLILNQNHSV